MKRPVFSISVLALTLLFPHTSRAGNPTLEAILSQIRQADAAREEAIRDMVYTAETTILEWEDPSHKTIKSETQSIRRVYQREPNQLHNEYLSMTIDGRRLSEREMDRELAKQRRGTRRQGDEEPQSPFSFEMADVYEFGLKGEGIFDDRAVWLVDFRPKEPEENLFTGVAFISQSFYQPVYMEMAPAELPKILEEVSMSVRFAQVGDFWLPSVFAMKMRVHISFLVTLTDRTFSVEDRYSDYRLNVGLDAGMFEKN